MASMGQKGGAAREALDVSVFIDEFEKVNSPKNRQLDILIGNSEQQVDDFMGELTL